MRLSHGYGAVDLATLGTERQFPQDGAARLLVRLAVLGCDDCSRIADPNSARSDWREA
jgi:hypothetical protein